VVKTSETTANDNQESKGEREEQRKKSMEKKKSPKSNRTN
jgi:hypothetical protein